MKNNNKLTAISARIDTNIVKDMNKLMATTKKPVAAFVQDAILEYMALLDEKNYTPSKALQIDRYAKALEKA